MPISRHQTPLLTLNKHTLLGGCAELVVSRDLAHHLVPIMIECVDGVSIRCDATSEHATITKNRIGACTISMTVCPRSGKMEHHLPCDINGEDFP